MPRTIERLRRQPPPADRAAADSSAAFAFPGYRSFRLTRDAVDTYHGRFEFWDAATETVHVLAEPTGGTHEQPSRRLAGLCRLIASLRGGAIECRGSVDLIRNAGEPERRRILQADEVVWLYPGRARIPDGGLRLGVHDRPDVVLEVDHTTDVRRGKLGLYAAWGFPEVWVEVPDVATPSRPPGLAPGLTVHRLDGARYRTATASAAFPGWTAAEIHAALNETKPSSATDRVLDRVARALGDRDGTRPDDTPWLRRARAEGAAAGFDRGRAAERAAVLRTILAGRGVRDSEPALAAVDLAALPLEELLAAARDCRDAADLRARLARPRRADEPHDE